MLQFLRLIYTLVCLILGTCSTHATTLTEQQKLLWDDVPENNNPFTPDFHSFVEQTIAEWKVAGVSIAVVDGDNVFAKGYGFATLPDTPATPETLWYAGSTTKAFTAAVLAHMINSEEYPELSRGWQTPIASLIRDDFVLYDRSATDHTTLEDAVCHRSGQPEAGFGPRYNSTAKEIVRNMRNTPLISPPRTKFHYNNDMFCVLSHVIETLIGKPIGEVFRDLIWGPLNMDATYLDLQQAIEAPQHLSMGYFWNKTSEEHIALYRPPTGPLSGAGAIISNVVDYAKWIQCLLREGAPLKKEVHQDIRMPRFIDEPTPKQGLDISLYGLGWWRTMLHGNVVYWHSGSTFTHGTLVYWLPYLDYGVVVMMNYASPSRQVLMRKLVEDRLGTPLKHRHDITTDLKNSEQEQDRLVKDADDILFPNRPTTPVMPSLKLGEYVGSYYCAGYGMLSFSEYEDDTVALGSILVANLPDLLWQPEISLRFVSGEFWIAFVAMNGLSSPSFTTAEFHLGVDGKVQGLWIGAENVNGPNEGRVYFERKL